MIKSPENCETDALLGPSVGRRLFLGQILVVVALSSTLIGSPALGQRGRRRRRFPGRRRRRRRRIIRRAIRRSRRRDPRVHERARRAVRRGDVRPLRDVFRLLRRQGNAEVLDVDLFTEQDRWVYAIRVLTRSGRVRDVMLDAKTLDRLQVN